MWPAESIMKPVPARSRALSFTTSNPTRMKATTSRRRIRKSSPKCSAKSTRCCRVSPRKCRNHGPRRRSAAPIPLYPPERILDRIFDRVVVSSSSGDVLGQLCTWAQIPRPSRLGKRGRFSLERWIGRVAGRTVRQSDHSRRATVVRT